jgi:hypothetical protein
MPLQLPNLDDRRYADLVDEARSLIPTYAPEWTNHNPSDPGITLVELFAHLTEMLIYRLNRVTSDNVLSFLKLLNGPKWKPFGKDPDQLTANEIAQAVPETILQLRKLERAITPQDFETLALEADPRVGRALCLPRLNIDVDSETERAGHVSMIILPRFRRESDEPESDLPGMITAVENYLAPKLLLTTRLHVIGPRFLQVRMAASVVPLSDELELDVKQEVAEAVRAFLDPRLGGVDGDGWPFGRNVFMSEIIALIDQLPGVDYVTAVSFSPDVPGRLINNTDGDLIGVEVKPYELVEAVIAVADITVQVP